MAIPSAFVVISLTSAFYVAASTNNYLGFYPGIEQVAASISTLTLVTLTNPNLSSILARTIVDNPSGYSGFRVGLVLHAYFLPSNKSNGPLFETRPITMYTTSWTGLAPHGQALINMTTTLEVEDGASLSHYLALNSGNVKAHTTLDLYISTFLDSALGAFNTNPSGTVQDVPLIVS